MLDAGALQALASRHVRLLVDLRRAHDLGLPLRIPAGALAQAWRGGPRSASVVRLLKQPCTIVSVDERSAREIGESIATSRLAEQEKPDVVDARVALVARTAKSLVWTSDPEGMARYQAEAVFVRKV